MLLNAFVTFERIFSLVLTCAMSALDGTTFQFAHLVRQEVCKMLAGLTEVFSAKYKFRIAKAFGSWVLCGIA